MMRLWLMAVPLVAAVSGAFADDLAVLKSASGEVPPSRMMHVYLQQLAHECFDRRGAEYEKLKTAEDIALYQKRLRGFFIDHIGGLPERTPLNARVVGTIERDDCRVEKIVFESRPQHYVTALMYLPKSDPPYPGVLVPCGHSAKGKGEEAYQRISLLLARNGLAALCYDPIGQGERSQVLDKQAKPIYGSVHEHTLVGQGAILLGRNTAQYRIWDGMRAIDYLASRAEIDPNRIGCTGNSGGGTLTSYLMALDDRIVCAAPSCYLTSMRRLIDTIGPQDAEQDIFGQVAFGMDHADYIIMRAPRPTLICSATRDFFDIGGTWETFREAKRIYTRMGFAERVDLIETDETHGFTKLLREGAVRWMRRWLMHVDEPITEPDFPVLTEEQYRCTPAGQVMLMEGARSVVDLNVECEKKLSQQRQRQWAEKPRAEMLQGVRSLVGVRPLADLVSGVVEAAGEIDRDGCRVAKLVFHHPAYRADRSSPGTVVPGLLFEPLAAGPDVYLYLHGEGKHVDASPDGPIVQLVRQGHRVLAVDLPGIGETEGEETHKGWKDLFGLEWQDVFLAYLLGKSYVGLRCEAILACAHYLKQGRPDVEPGRVHMIAIGEAGVPALHAAAFEPDLFASTEIRGSLQSWKSVVDLSTKKNQLINTVHGALTTYDLPDLVASLPPERLKIVDPVTSD